MGEKHLAHALHEENDAKMSARLSPGQLPIYRRPWEKGASQERTTLQEKIGISPHGYLRKESFRLRKITRF